MLGMLAFIRPLLLLGAPLVVGFLLYSYLKRGKHQARTFSTLLFLKDFQTKAPKRAKITIPKRFYLELLALLLLLVAASGAYLSHTGEKIALVFDNSLSTAAVSSTHGPVIEYLSAQANEALSEHAIYDSVDLFVTNSPEIQKVNLSPSEVEKALYHIKPQFGADGLERTLGQVALGGYDKIYVVTDKSPSEQNDTFRFFPLERVTDASNNIAIERTILRDEEGDKALFVTLRSFMSKDTRAKITVTSFGREGDSVGQKDTEVVVPAMEGITERIIVGSSPSIGYGVSLSFASGADDQLALDNTSYVSSKSVDSEEVVFVGDLDPISLHLDKIKRFSVKGIKPSEYSAFSESNSPRLYIFHRNVPTEIPNRSALFIAPPEKNLLFPVVGEYQNLPLSRWMESHPLTNYLNLSLLTIPTASIVSPLPWQEVVLATSEGPVLTAGETRGNRYVVSGFEQFPFGGKESPFLSVLTLNVLSWLSEASGDTPLNSDASGREFKVIKNIRPLNDESFAEVPGLYAVKNSRGLEEIQATNFFDSSESNVKNKTVVLPSSQAPVTSMKQDKDGKGMLAGLVALLVATLIVLDVLYLFKQRRFIGQSRA